MAAVWLPEKHFVCTWGWGTGVPSLDSTAMSWARVKLEVWNIMWLITNIGMLHLLAEPFVLFTLSFYEPYLYG